VQQNIAIGVAGESAVMRERDAPIFNGIPGLNSWESQPKPMRGMRDMGEVDKLISQGPVIQVVCLLVEYRFSVQMTFGK